MNKIKVRGGRIHNLKNIDIDIPKGKFIVITGVSGSGKSSLAFDLLFEEGRKRYLQSIGLSTNSDWDGYCVPYDEIKGLPPAISVEQRTIRQSNPRSVVGTKTKMLDYVKWLFSLEGRDIEGVKPKYPVDTFSYHSPSGMCQTCYGRGFITELDINRMIPDHDKTLGQICNRLGEFAKKLYKFLHNLGEKFQFDWQNELYRNLPINAKQTFLYGDSEFEGLFPFAKRTMDRTLRSRLVGETRLCSSSACTECRGFRVGELARTITLHGTHIGHVSNMSIRELKQFILDMEIEPGLSEESVPFIQLLLTHCEQMIDVGLAYLTLLRTLPSLSGGELQRLFLMGQLQSDFDSLLYIFDEPTAGLHEVEKANFLNRLHSLTDLGNTVIVVEHDPMVIKQAEYIVEIGPGAGKEGGQVVFKGNLEQFMISDDSVLGPYIAGRKSLSTKPSQTLRLISKNTPKLMLCEANLHNLKNVNVKFPLGVMIGVTGRSGSGKSTLISGTLVPLLQYCLEIEPEEEMDEEVADTRNSLNVLGRLEGWSKVRKCVVVSQAPIGRSRLSTPVSYIGIWDKIRELYASQPQAVGRAYTAGHFSFNTEEGACPVCKGEGAETVELGPLGQMNRTCPICQGSRYKQEILEIEYRGYNINRLLRSSVNEVISLFTGYKAIEQMLLTLQKVGLGYLSLGQSATTLSGGEAQRIKLAKELGKARKSGSLFILDEPTTGLSYPDSEKLMLLLNEIINEGNTVIITEHDASILSHCDWLVEMGPGGGIEGGSIIAEGTPAQLRGNVDSLIGPYL